MAFLLAGKPSGRTTLTVIDRILHSRLPETHDGTERESTRKAFDCLGDVLDTLVAARRVLNLVPGWEAIRGNEEKRS
jgi:hypothetical protein